MVKTLIAIDPGSVSGAFAIFNRAGIILGDLPVVHKQVNASAFAIILHEAGVEEAVVERVGAMPKQGVASTFRFGYGCGLIFGTLVGCGVPVSFVTPRQWKASYKLPGGAIGKEMSRQLAVQFYPGLQGLELKKHHGRADALLLGRWFRHYVLKGGQP